MPTYASCSRPTPPVHTLYDSCRLRCSRIKEWRAEDEAKKKRLEEHLLCLPGLGPLVGELHEFLYSESTSVGGQENQVMTCSFFAVEQRALRDVVFAVLKREDND